MRSATEAQDEHHVALATTPPTNFSRAVEMALGREEGVPFHGCFIADIRGIGGSTRRVAHVKKSDGLDRVKGVIVEEVRKEKIGG